MEADHREFVQIQPMNYGDGGIRTNKGDTIRVEYTGWLNEDGKKGPEFDASSDFVTKIGEGRVIKGWEVAIPDMTLGETSILLIDRSYTIGGR
ncbi:MAG: FK506 binding protein proline rotamase rapamycin-binding protein [Geoglossum simile]|nr:MAG: FK506 binding protein proline rotamase rapamycin-binding protein [Geoglossum simile]